ncbi:hypothetical protein ON010_g16323 [Phytophthora cinnamomi]|nr:hypothetical protein ON010_g16323 [Phytophthora cinnamomi]
MALCSPGGLSSKAAPKQAAYLEHPEELESAAGIGRFHGVRDPTGTNQPIGQEELKYEDDKKGKKGSAKAKRMVAPSLSSTLATVKYFMAKQKQDSDPQDRVFSIFRQQPPKPKASEVAILIDGKGVSDGWYRGFLVRYPALGNHKSQVVTKDRSAVSKTYITTLFWSLTKVVIEHKVEPSRIYNVDETAFERCKKLTRVVALRGSHNGWHTDPTILICCEVAAAGKGVPSKMARAEEAGVAIEATCGAFNRLHVHQA